MSVSKIFADRLSADSLSLRAIELHLRQTFVERPTAESGSCIPMQLAVIAHHQHVLHGQRPKPFTGLVPSA